MRIPLILLAAVSLSIAALAGDNWPMFRGPNNDGHSDSIGLPLTWSETENVVWKTAIHDKGWSSPVVWGDQVWMTTAKADGTELFAVCVDRKTGAILHDIKLYEQGKQDPAHNPGGKNSYASPTPAIEEGRVYIHFGSCGTACLDVKTGDKIWERRDLKCDHWRGPASSPILYGDLLILTFDGYDAQYVIALDKKDGHTVWKKDRDFNYGTDDGDRRKAFATPTIITVKGKPELISPAAVATTAYDPLTGDELWVVYHGGMNVTQPPLYTHGHVILGTGDAPTKMLAVRPDGGGDLTKNNIDWICTKNVPARSSPIAVDDLLYFTNEVGMLSCIDAGSGDPVWQQRVGGSFWASPLCADGRLYLFDDEGTTTVVEPGRTWKKLAANKLDDGCMATPAVAGKALFIRTKTSLYRIEKKD
ncbi:MAG TPA: PQQ-binding-like beta-propeller repeat protein [Gemmataceae bacterium]|nr:PQQ-binding-like beta-propeller repeat protein [Gemmataceae bacterium]